jgi:hypothetical protein
MSEEVWVQLYIEKDKSGQVFDIEIASFPRNRISVLARAVHQARGKSLGHCDAADLVVYKAGTEFPPKEEDKLDPGEAVPADTTSKSPLRVLAPAIANQQGKNLLSTIPISRYFTNAHRFQFFLVNI